MNQTLTSYIFKVSGSNLFFARNSFEIHVNQSLFYKKNNGFELILLEDHESAQWCPVFETQEFANDEGLGFCWALGEFWSYFHPENTQLHGYYDFSKDISKNEEVSLYGGSFNPAHEGHRECVRQCGHYPLILVTDRNPFKSQTKISCEWSRFKYLTEYFKSEQCLLYPGFLGSLRPNYTVDWIEGLSGKKNLVIGEDNLLGLRRWKDWEKLLSLITRLIVIPRERQVLSLDVIKELEALFPDLIIERQNQHEYEHLSSSELRKN